MHGYNAVRIADPVHGTIGLSALELAVVDTQAFQRLRTVRQLGLAYLVFPGADYSRFEHSLGVCHITGRIFASLAERGSFDARTVQLYRLAGLLHDIGHYPFSHLTEDAVVRFYHDRPGGALTHEMLGREVLRRDSELRGVLEGAGFSPDEVASIFTHEAPALYENLISSDLDADRIDYLLRTASHTGLPYGSVDIDYLLAKTTIDASGKIALAPSAIRPADHFLLCRFFDYQQIPFYKTVIAFDHVYKAVLLSLFDRGDLDCSASAVTAMLGTEAWYRFDDVAVLGRLRTLATEPLAEPVRSMVAALVERRPPRLVAEYEVLLRRERSTREEFTAKRTMLRALVPRLAAGSGVPEEQFFVWDHVSELTKTPHLISSYEAGLSGEQSIRILDPATGLSEPIMEHPRSLMSILSNYALYALRLYALLPDDGDGLHEGIRNEVHGALPFMHPVVPD